MKNLDLEQCEGRNKYIFLLNESNRNFISYSKLNCIHVSFFYLWEKLFFRGSALVFYMETNRALAVKNANLIICPKIFVNC